MFFELHSDAGAILGLAKKYKMIFYIIKNLAKFTHNVFFLNLNLKFYLIKLYIKIY